MALCSFSNAFSLSSFTILDNSFFMDFLPEASGSQLKVYLYGRFLCTSQDETNNSLESMCRVLGLSEDELISCFSYWQTMGLVQITSTSPLEVQFLPIKQFSGSSKIRNKEKYDDFNKRAQEILSGRLITPHEYNEYYTLIETYKFEPEAVLMIIKYCTSLKSNSINYPYILAVAKSLMEENIKTAAALEEKLIEQEKSSEELKSVLSSLGLKRPADMEERNLYLKWINGYGFTHGVILYVAKKQNQKGGMHKLDENLTKYFELKLFTINEIENYAVLRENLFNIAKTVTRNIGQYYQVLDSVVDNYVSGWVQKGFSENMLNLISKYCFTMNYRTLELMDDTINKFYKLGLVSEDAVNQHIKELNSQTQQIKEILDILGLVRNVNSYDRELFKTWTSSWEFSLDAIKIVAENAKNKEHPISYISKILGDLYNRNIKQEDEIKKALSEKEYKSVASTQAKNDATNFAQRDYTKEDLSALFDSLDDIEI
ncbi:MAG: DnaD domain protein [Clostridia bacterium]|nr:DnaD domain protein [Clostridia bacterium]